MHIYVTISLTLILKGDFTMELVIAGIIIGIPIIVAIIASIVSTVASAVAVAAKGEDEE